GVAKNPVAADSRTRAGVQPAWPIGVAEPISLRADRFGTPALAPDRLERLVRDHFDLTPRGIIDALDLRRPIYRATAYHGHFGREDQGFPWEETSRADALRRAAGR